MDSSDEEFDAVIHDLDARRDQQPRVYRQRQNFEAISDQEHRERFRIPRAAIDWLEHRIGDRLMTETNRNYPLTPREKILIFLNRCGANQFFHTQRDLHGVSKAAAHRSFHEVLSLLSEPEVINELIKWPENCQSNAAKFQEIGGMISTCAIVDGFHVAYTPPHDDEDAYVNRHHSHSLNCMGLVGPDGTFYAVSTKSPGKWHDSRVMRDSQVWQAFEVQGQRPFPGAIVLGDSAYALTNWLIPPFPGDPEGAKGRFNKAHKKTRSFVERQIGIVKSRFYILKTGIRMKRPADASKLVQVCIGLHNLAIRLGDNGDDFEDDADEEDADQAQAEEQGDAARQAQTRRDELLRAFE